MDFELRLRMRPQAFIAHLADEEHVAEIAPAFRIGQPSMQQLCAGSNVRLVIDVRVIPRVFDRHRMLSLVLLTMPPARSCRKVHCIPCPYGIAFASVVAGNLTFWQNAAKRGSSR